jgi:hypothetical protein
MTNADSHPETTQERRIDILLAAYSEVCASYHAIDEFRTKLLGILPIASLAGILLLGKDNLFQADSLAQRLVGFASFFAAAFTLSLFLFEIRGILRCHHLIERGAQLEEALNVKGQFFVCSHQHAQAAGSRLERVFNAKVAASAVYSLVFAAWLFLALRFTFGFHLVGCGLTATILGGALGFGVHSLLNRRIPA